VIPYYIQDNVKQREWIPGPDEDETEDRDRWEVISDENQYDEWFAMEFGNEEENGKE
jgi:hypothetical protein